MELVAQSAMALTPDGGGEGRGVPRGDFGGGERAGDGGVAVRSSIW